MIIRQNKTSKLIYPLKIGGFLKKQICQGEVIEICLHLSNSYEQCEQNNQNIWFSNTVTQRGAVKYDITLKF